MNWKEHKIFYASGFGVLLSAVGNMLHWSQAFMFVIDCLTIIALASMMGRATESLAIWSGPRLGGLLNATFGNAVELIISVFALQAGLNPIVLASLTGSVIGNLLLVGGLSFFVGGMNFKQLKFNKYDARHSIVLLIFSVVVAFGAPKVFSMELTTGATMHFSVGISIVMILLYLSMLLFKFVTHRGAYQDSNEKITEHETPEWSKGVSIMILAAATLAVSYVSEALVHTFHEVATTFGWSEFFIGVIVVAIVGNAAEHASAVLMARKNKAGVSVEIAMGSTLQIAMFVAPVLVLISLFFSPMPLVFSSVELTAMGIGSLIISIIIADGDTNWMEGLVLLATYMVLGIGCFLL